jgi:hypothetical protein
MATKRKIEQILIRLRNHYPMAKLKYSAETLDSLVRDWNEDLYDIPDHVLTEAVSKVRRRSEWFPVSAQVRKEAEELLQRKEQRQALPVVTSDQHIEIGQKRAREILANLAAKKGMES